MKAGAAREVRKSRWPDLNSVGPTKRAALGSNDPASIVEFWVRLHDAVGNGV